MDEAAGLAAALEAFRAASGVSILLPDWLDPDVRAGMTCEILTWYAAREGPGPWCWQCAKPATLWRAGLETGAGSHWCRGCAGPGVYQCRQRVPAAGRSLPAMARLEVTFHTSRAHGASEIDDLTGRIADALPAMESAHPWLYDADLCADLEAGTVIVAASLRGEPAEPVNAPILALVTACDTERLLTHYQIGFAPDELAAIEDTEAATRLWQNSGTAGMFTD